MTDKHWQQARNILCIRLDYLGDVLMCTPAIRALRTSLSDSKITLLTSRSGAAAVPFIPEIDDVITYAAPWMKSSQAHAAEMDFAFMKQLRAEKFDAAVIFTTYSQSPLPAAMLCYLSGIPRRLAHCHENPYQLLTDWLPDPEPDKLVRHEVQRQLDLVAAIGCFTDNQQLSFQVTESDRTWMQQRLQAIGIQPGRPWVMCHPGATAASRRYPAQHWVEVARALGGQSDLAIVFTGGGPEEIALIEEIRQGAGGQTFSLAGELDLGKLGAAISLASVVICNNTGPAHLAAAIGTPLVDLYALTNPQHTPWQVKSVVLFHDVSCRFCYKSACPQGHHRCLDQIAPMEVVSAVHALLGQETYRQADHHTLLANLFHLKHKPLPQPA
jgi:lipopolysaccharide heptosyltransferase II